MKIEPEHYQYIKNAFLPYKNFISTHREVLRANPRVKDLEMRLRWDFYHAYVPNTYTSNLYKYMTDDHIDTALKNIIQELEESR